MAAVRAEAVRQSSVEDASASDDDAPPRAVSPTLEAARPVSPIMSPAQTPAAVDVIDAPPPAVDAIRLIPDAVDAAPPAQLEDDDPGVKAVHLTSTSYHGQLTIHDAVAWFFKVPRHGRDDRI